MRWRKCYKRLPRDGEERTIRKFLWLPKCIGNEYRWLESVEVQQHYIAGFFTNDASGTYIAGD